MLVLLTLTAAVATPATPLRTHIVAQGLSCTIACEPTPPRSRYRLDAQASDDGDTKRQALATEGSECSVVGGRVCTRKPRTLLVADID